MSYNKLFEKIIKEIRDSKCIIISRHINPDGDAYGSAFGLQRLIQHAFGKSAIVCNDHRNDNFKFLGREEFPTHDLMDGALLIVVDTATPDRIDNHLALLARSIIKIDHHVEQTKDASYWDLKYIDDKRSSASELVVDFANYLIETKIIPGINKETATPLYCGVMCDTGNFAYGMTPKTFRAAEELLCSNVDYDALRIKVFNSTFDEVVFRADAIQNAKLTENGVAYVIVDEELRNKYELTDVTAGSVIDQLRSIKGSIIYAAFIYCCENVVRGRLRSRYIPIRPIAEKYGGGGHDNASGIVLSSMDQIKDVLTDLDSLIKEYKEKNPEVV